MEIAGPTQSAKSEIVLNLICATILSVEKNCEGKHVLVLDLDRKFDLLRLSTLLEHAIRRALVLRSLPAREEDVEDLIRQALDSLHIVQVSSFFECRMTLLSLKRYLRLNPKIDLVVIDPATCLFMERYHGSTTGPLDSSLCSSIAELLKGQRVKIVATKQLFRNSAGALYEPRENIDFEWTKLVNYRFVVQSDSSPRGFTVRRIGSEIHHRFHIDEDGIRPSA